ncbi:hypothetical protein DL93DRAFT_1094008 [Clavulina sp. PMI_390]|nr:hypothetical protein DL93DRAFT_1094008 [Clavulina sp. PMI_390]
MPCLHLTLRRCFSSENERLERLPHYTNGPLCHSVLRHHGNLANCVLIGCLVPIASCNGLCWDPHGCCLKYHASCHTAREPLGPRAANVATPRPSEYQTNSISSPTRILVGQDVSTQSCHDGPLELNLTKRLDKMFPEEEESRTYHPESDDPPPAIGRASGVEQINKPPSNKDKCRLATVMTSVLETHASMWSMSDLE